MASLNDYKRHIQVLKMEQKIGRIQKELESVDYGDGCPFYGENDCAEVRKAYDRGYANGLYEALTLFKLIEADTPQTDWEKEKSEKSLCNSCGKDCDNRKRNLYTVECNRYEPQTDCGWK